MKNKIMISKKEYNEAKKLIKDYKKQQLNIPVVSKSVTCDHNYPHVQGWSIHQPSHCSNCGKDL